MSDNSIKAPLFIANAPMCPYCRNIFECVYSDEYNTPIFIHSDNTYAKCVLDGKRYTSAALVMQLDEIVD